MKPDQGLEATRAIREKISRDYGNDPRRLIEHYIAQQRRFGDRLRWSHGAADEATGERDKGSGAKQEVPTPDGGAARR